MKNYLLVIILLLSTGITLAQEFKFTKGAITDSIPIPGVKDATYAVYLPSDFTSEKKWPVIFVFDPQGRGRSAASLFKPAAEEQDYLIASANFKLNSRPVDSIINTAMGMVNSFMTGFPVANNQVYAAGLSEGAQVASAMPLIYNGMAGILAVGNSFLNTDYIKKNQPYKFIGVAGKKDYMVYKMEEYINYFDKIDFPTEVYYFDGGEDEWPETEVVYNAVSGFTIQAMRQGERLKDPELLKRMYEHETSYVERMVNQLRSYDAYEQLARMEDKYEDLGFEDDIKKRMKTLKRSDAFRKQRREFRDITAYERQQQADFEYLLTSDIATANFQNIGWWAYQVDEIKKLKNSPNNLKSNLAFRLHSYLDVLSKQKFRSVTKSGADIDIKIFVSVLRTAIAKEDPEAYFKIVSLAASDGDVETALLYLEDLLKTGYSDMEGLYNIEGALDLTLSKEFNELVKKYLGKAKFYN